MKRSVLVTGGTMRLGAAIADAFAVAGWRVVRSSHRADANADVRADLSRPGGADELFARAFALLGGRPDVLVNNAALYIGAADDETTWQVNYHAPRRLAELMEGSLVVNICDKFAATRHPGTAYAQSKTALEKWSRESGLLAFEVGDVLDLAPAAFREKAVEAAGDRLTSRQIAARLVKMLPM